MKTVEEKIIERFQNADFDPQGVSQQKVFVKITKGENLMKKSTFALVLIATVVILSVFSIDSMKKEEKEFEKSMATVLSEENEADSSYANAAPAAADMSPISFAEPLSLIAEGSSKMSLGVASFRAPSAYEVDYNSLKDESYIKRDENKFKSTRTDPLSTFSADVDTASYTIVKRMIESGQKPNPDSVRIEEFINYFDYDYLAPAAKSDNPVNIIAEYTDSPWNKGLKLAKIALKAKEIDVKDIPPSNLVFLIDISGSMEQSNRLPLVQKSLNMLLDSLRAEDTVSIVTYASGTQVRLDGAKGSDKEKIKNVVNSLQSGGGTSGSEGLKLAYETAKKHFKRKGNNRVILATDGDFNIGPRSNAELENQITEARETGVFLSVLGYGMGNYKDDKVQTLANKGNGNYAYINDLYEAKKVLVNEFGSTMFTVAKDVKLQAEFNPSKVAAYRLVGYEKRLLNNEDFNDDTKDAGEMGAGHKVTVFYEIIPAGVKSEFLPDIDDLKYSSAKNNSSKEILTVKMRYKDPDSDKSKLLKKSLLESDYVKFDLASEDTRFAAAVAQFGQLLKDSNFKGTMSLKDVVEVAREAKGKDKNGYRADFIRLADLATPRPPRQPKSNSRKDVL